MNSFTVRVRSTTELIIYSALGTDSASVHMAAIDRFGVCAITVIPA